MTRQKAAWSTIREGEWTVHRIHLPEPADLCRLAAANQRLPGRWKYVLETPEDRLCLRLEVSELDSEPACDPFDDVASEPVPASAEWIREMQGRVEAAGYPCHAREDRLIVSLAAWQAEITPEADGCVMLRAVTGSSEHAATREALAMLLLRAGGCMRVARGFLGALPETEVGFLTRLARAGSDEQLTEALEALAACCDRFRKSVSVLENEQAAHRYLALSTVHSDQFKGELQTC